MSLAIPKAIHRVGTCINSAFEKHQCFLETKLHLRVCIYILSFRVQQHQRTRLMDSCGPIVLVVPSRPRGTKETMEMRVHKRRPHGDGKRVYSWVMTLKWSTKRLRCGVYTTDRYSPPETRDWDPRWIHKPRPCAYQYLRTPSNESNATSLRITTKMGYLDVLLISRDETSQRDWTETSTTLNEESWPIHSFRRYTCTRIIQLAFHSRISPLFFHSIPSSSSNPHLIPFQPDSQ